MSEVNNSSKAGSLTASLVYPFALTCGHLMALSCPLSQSQAPKGLSQASS